MSSFTVRQSIEAMEEYAVESVAADIIVNANESNYQLPQERFPSAPHASRLTVIRRLNRKTCARLLPKSWMWILTV